MRANTTNPGTRTLRYSESRPRSRARTRASPGIFAMSASVISDRSRGGFGESDLPFSAARRRDDARFVGLRSECFGLSGPTGSATGPWWRVRGTVGAPLRNAVLRLPAVPLRFLLRDRLRGDAMVNRTP